MIINRDVYENSYTDEELMQRIEDAESWDEVTDEMTVLARQYDIDEHTEAGEWKLGDELLEEIKAAIEKANAEWRDVIENR